MVDLYLQAMMQGQIVNRKKNKFDEAMSREIKHYVDSLPLEEDIGESQLVSPRMKRIKLMEELKEEAKMTELTEYIEKAFSFLRSDGLHYLEPSALEKLTLALKNSAKLLKDLDLSQEMPKDDQMILGFSNETLAMIYQVATGAYRDERFESCLAVFVLLATLNPANPEYWFRTGIAAQKNELIDIALRAYAIASSLVPELIGARLFAAECYLAKGALKEAAEEVIEAKKIKETSEPEPMWLELLDLLEQSIGT